MKYLLLFLFFAFFSCNPLKHYQKVATDTNVTPEKKATIAPWVATYFDPGEPVIIKGKDSIVERVVVDTATIDSLSNQLDSLLHGTNINVDSLKAAIMKACVPKTVVKDVYHTTTVEMPSSAQQAKIYSLQRENQQLTAINTNLTNDNTNLTNDNTVLKDQVSSAKKSARTNRFLFIGSILVILALLYLLFKPKIHI